MGKTTVTAAIAKNQSIAHKMVSIKYDDMNKIPIEEGTVFYQEFFMSWVPNSSAVTAIYALFFSVNLVPNIWPFVIQFPTVAHNHLHHLNKE
jgi:hypothetical protein